MHFLSGVDKSALTAGQGFYELTRMRARAIEQARHPQTAQSNWAIGCLEWQAEQEKAKLSGRT